MGASNFKWPVQVDQARITSPYNASTGNIGFFAPNGTPVRAIAKGKVSSVSEDSVQITSEQFAVVYANLQNIKVQAGQVINAVRCSTQMGWRRIGYHRGKQTLGKSHMESPQRHPHHHRRRPRRSGKHNVGSDQESATH